MPAERFFIDAPLQGILSMEGTEFHHLARVMRIRVGEEVELVNGKGSLAQSKVTQITKERATLEILSVISKPLLPPRYLLGIPLMRPSKLELIVEKCTELGTDAFWFYPAQHSEKDDLSKNLLERLHMIMLSAMKQCGRLDLPSIQIFPRLEELFTSSCPIFFGDTRPHAQKIAHQKAALFITGPEKGFSEKEIKLLDQKAKGVSLHENILRAETAPLVALLKVQS